MVVVVCDPLCTDMSVLHVGANLHGTHQTIVTHTNYTYPEQSLFFGTQTQTATEYNTYHKEYNAGRYSIGLVLATLRLVEQALKDPHVSSAAAVPSPAAVHARVVACVTAVSKSIIML